jgi:hypothetical protein
MRWMALLVVLAVGSCTWQHQSTKQLDPWAAACADVAELYDIDTCDYDAPDIVYNSLLMEGFTGAFGVFVYDEWRMYLASAAWITQNGYTVDLVQYHESIHAVLHKDQKKGRCDSERIARELTDKRFGTDSANSGWEIPYKCVSPTQMM